MGLVARVIEVIIMLRIILIAFFVGLLGGCASLAQAPAPNVIQVVHIDGVIDGSTVEQVLHAVDRIESDASVKAVLLTVNSPGGGVQAIAEVVEQLDRIKVPVVAWCNEVCASGGAFVMMAKPIKFIAMRAGGITGSIGVIQYVLRDEAPDRLEVYRSGKLKQANSRPGTPTDDEKAYLQKQVDEIAAVFFAQVKAARGDKISPASWEEIKTARVFYDHRAVDVGLVDAIMSYREAAKKAAELSGVHPIETRES